MQIKFHTTLYDLVENPNVFKTRFQATIEKGNNSFDDIVADTFNITDIIVYDDEGKEKAVYSGYTKRIAISIQPDSYISIELENTNLEEMIDSLASDINKLEEVQDAHTNNLSELNAEVENLTPYTETKTAYYEESEKTFYGVPEGRVSVFFSNYNGSYSINRIEDRLTVSFDTLENETDITIQIQ